MPYVRIWVHLIWSTKNREALLTGDIRQKVFDHIQMNATKKELALNCIGGSIDHVHTLISLHADQSISKAAQLLKGESSFWINKEGITKCKFEWQDEYIAVSVSESGVGAVRKYIGNQQEHHRRKSFAEEYAQFEKAYKFVKG
jgi:REP element-mobilizing transposase RayT